MSDLDQKVEERREADVAVAWTEVLGTWAGRLVLWEIMSEGGLFRNPYTGNAETNFLCGKQHMAQWIAANLSPEDLFSMQKDHVAFMDEIENAIKQEKTDEPQ